MTLQPFKKCPPDSSIRERRKRLQMLLNGFIHQMSGNTMPYLIDAMKPFLYKAILAVLKCVLIIVRCIATVYTTSAISGYIFTFTSLNFIYIRRQQEDSNEEACRHSIMCWQRKTNLFHLSMIPIHSRCLHNCTMFSTRQLFTAAAEVPFQ